MNSPSSTEGAVASPEASFSFQLLRAGERLWSRPAPLDCPADEWDLPEPATLDVEPPPAAPSPPTTQEATAPRVEPPAPEPSTVLSAVDRPAPVREPHPDGLLDYNDLAAFLNIPKGTLYNLVWQNKIPHVRLGPKTVRFERQAIDVWLTKRRSRR
jgi:excisionase family DNA binding protein